MLDVDALLRPYLDSLSEEVGGLALYDAHTHVGANDPDGFTRRGGDLTAKATIIAPS